MEKKTDIAVVITEDHHEVLPHIYRRIGSKLLPFSQLTLLHFDSHPDLLIPIDMSADDVFDTELLYQTMSIENWIMPAVYAGHIDHVIWIKPPWCDQISDKQTRFHVGKCSDTGRIRLSSTENYFLSEALFVPEEKLLNKKSFCLTVLTLQPDCWQDLPVKEKSELDRKEDLTVIDKNVGLTNKHPKSNNDISSCKLQTEENSLVKGDKSDTTPAMNQSESSKKIQDGVKMKSTLSKSNNTTIDTTVCQREKHCETPCDISHQMSRESGKFTDNSHASSSKDYVVPSKKTRIDVHDDSADICDITRKRTGVEKVLKKLKSELEGKCFILDIDLDFFSTMNPFRTILTEFQYNSLRKLYRFTPPASTEPKIVFECLKKREQQLNELKSSILSGESHHLVGGDRDRLTLLLKDVQKTGEVTGNVIERELLHEAGCTCDDTELPHHVSSEEQIQELTICMEQLLSGLSQPNMITIARSSLDDYCPPEQVDFIQDLVLENLNNVYHQLTVQKDYDVPEADSAERL